MKTRIPWVRPTLRQDEELSHDHKTSWLELFYDLVFIAIVAQIAARFAEHPSIHSAVENVLFFLPILWSWLGFVFYNDRFESEDFSQRFFTTIKMAIVVLIALALQDHSENAIIMIVWLYVALRVFLVFMWVRAGWHNPLARPLTNRYALGFCTSIAIWIASLYCDPESSLWLRGCGFLIDLFTPMLTLKAQSVLPKLTSSHFSERFGLLVLIALGEIISKVVSHRSLDGGGATPYLVVFGVFFGVVTWLIYFDQIMGQKLKGEMGSRAFWVYMHLPLILGLVGFAGAFHYMADHHDVINGTARWIVANTFSMVLGALGLIQLRLESGKQYRSLQIVSCFLASFAAIGANYAVAAEDTVIFIVILGVFAGIPASFSFIEK